jgi:hypothetical protein
MVGASGTGSGHGEMAQEEEAKLVYGVVYSIRNIVNKLLTGKSSYVFGMNTQHNITKTNQLYTHQLHGIAMMALSATKLARTSFTILRHHLD